jgi:carbon monoxide dehydrogenase subunit G
MATIVKDIQVSVVPELAWDALRDVGRIHERLVPGFVSDCRLEGDIRVVTFGDGKVVRERIITVDDERRRVVWSALGEPFEHYNASVQVFALDGGRTRLSWVADLLPNELEAPIGAMIEQGLVVMKQTLERAHQETAMR